MAEYSLHRDEHDNPPPRSAPRYPMSGPLPEEKPEAESYEAKCLHCGQRIVRTNDWRGRPSWTHQPAGASFQDGEHVHCHLTRAEPKT